MTDLRPLGFYIEDRGGVEVVVYDNGSCRPSSGAESALWDLLCHVATARRGDCGGQEWTDFERLPKEIEDMWRQITDAIDCRSYPQ